MSHDIIGIEETHSRSLLMNMKSWGLIFVFDIYDNPGSQNLGFEDNHFQGPRPYIQEVLKVLHSLRQKFFFVKSSFVLVQFGVIFQIASNMPYGDFEGKVPKSLGQE
ncbi:17620_t:CDS:2, partial [Gigaspora rosea]